MRFGYLRDPLFMMSVATYFANRFLLKPLCKGAFIHEHLNDFLCIPFWVPIMLFAQRSLSLREGDDRPRSAEILIPLIVWSWTFEIILPATGWLGTHCVADYLDVFYYTLGALLAALWWRWWYGQSTVEFKEAPPGA